MGDLPDDLEEIGEVQAIPIIQPSLEELANSEILKKIEDVIGEIETHEYQGSELLPKLILDTAKKTFGELDDFNVGDILFIEVEKINYKKVDYNVGVKTETGAMHRYVLPLTEVVKLEKGIGIKPACPGHYEYTRRVRELFPKDPEGKPLIEDLLITVKLIGYVPKDKKNRIVLPPKYAEIIYRTTTPQMPQPESEGIVQVGSEEIIPIDSGEAEYTEIPQETEESHVAEPKKIHIIDPVEELENFYDKLKALLKQTKLIATEEQLEDLQRKVEKAGKQLEELRSNVTPAKIKEVTNIYDGLESELLRQF